MNTSHASDSVTPSKRMMPKRFVERIGKTLTGACIAVVVVLVVTLVAMVAQRGLATFTSDGVSFLDFIAGTEWNPHQLTDAGLPTVGALPMIAGSCAVTLLATIFALPIAFGSAIFVVEISPRFGKRVFQPLIELLVGIPSVVYGLIGLMVIVATTRDIGALFGAGITGYGIFSGAIVLAIMILPTVTSIAIDALAAVPASYREGSYALGCTRWQTIWNVVLRSALPSLMTAVILGMSRAFGEALAVQMVIGNAATMPTSLFTPAATLTSVLTMGMGNEAMGTVQNNVLWSLALLLMAMSLASIVAIHFIGRKGSLAHGKR